MYYIIGHFFSVYLVLVLQICHRNLFVNIWWHFTLILTFYNPCAQLLELEPKYLINPYIYIMIINKTWLEDDEYLCS